jgi:hypothetical protein
LYASALDAGRLSETVELYLMEPLRPGGSGLDELAELGRDNLNYRGGT